jgi:kynurenine 3-monooxygenase
MKHISLIGGGLVGSLLSAFLSKRGYSVKVFEKRPDMRTTSGYAGKSINLALSDRGWKAIKALGIESKIREIAIPMYKRVMHHQNGQLSEQPYGKNDQAIFSVSRGGINIALMDLAEKDYGVEFMFQHRCTAFNLQEGKATFVDDVTHEQRQVESDLFIAADGAFSSGRLHQQTTIDRFDYQQFYIDFGYKELHIPAGPGGNYLLEKEALHIWPRGNYMLIALPNTDGSFTCTLFFPFEGSPSFKELDSADKADAFFKEQFRDAYDLMPDFKNDFMHNPTSSLVTVKCWPWVNGNHLALIGDAAHAIVPFFGQGMNCGFEDCTVLNHLLDSFNDDWSLVLPEYQRLRKPDADAIADLALRNFVEMRDLVANPVFLLRKKIEAWFSDLHPDKWVPAYTLVTFSPEVRYSEALRRGMAQEKIMDEVMQMPDIENQWNSAQVEQLILSKVES